MNRLIPSFIAVCVCAMASCMNTKPVAPATKRITFSYDSLAALQAKDIPPLVYACPPLRSSKDGKPLEKLQPVASAGGGVTEWKTSSALSMELKREVGSHLTNHGYHVISFEELLAIRQPYSVLVISTFYTLPYDVKNDNGEVTDKATFVLIKGTIFDQNLDPKTKKDVIKVDGVTKVPVGKEFPDSVTRTLEQAYSWFADNSTGVILLD